jgi:hypothetical protein
VLLPAAGVCENPRVTSMADTNIIRNTRFMESSRDSRLAAVRFHLGFDFAVGPSRRTFAPCAPVNSGLGTWSIQSGTAPKLSVMDLNICSQPLTFGGTALRGKGADSGEMFAPPANWIQPEILAGMSPIFTPGIA